MKRNVIIVILCLLTILLFQVSIQESFAESAKSKAIRKQYQDKWKAEELKKLEDKKKKEEAEAKEKARVDAEEKARIVEWDNLAKQVVNKSSYIFLNIGENDTYKTVSAKISREFEAEAAEISIYYPTDLDYRFYDPIKGPDNENQIFKKTANNYYRSAQKMNAAESVIARQDKTMVRISYNPKQKDSIIEYIDFYCSKSNGKLLWYYVAFKHGTFNDLSKKFIEKFGDAKLVLASPGGRRSANPLDTSMRTAGNGFYYWEKDNDCAYLLNYLVMFDIPNTHEALTVIYGSNIDEYATLMKQIHEQKTKAADDKKSNAINKRF